MTIDRAIEILDPEHREHYESIDPVIEACRMGMEALERTRWIPCNERMPDEAGKYLCRVKNVFFPQNGFLIILWYNDGKWTDSYDCWENRATHWMPLPEPPEEVEFNAKE